MLIEYIKSTSNNKFLVKTPSTHINPPIQKFSFIVIFQIIDKSIKVQIIINFSN
jgi:hypothetical protein